MAFKILLLLFTCALLVKTQNNEEITCPLGCVCEMTQNLRSAFCIGEKLTTIGANIPGEVQYLDFSDNIISKIEDNAFKDQNINNLVILNMSTNSISQISLRAFEGLNKLQILDLSDNVLHYLPQDVFENNLELLKLYLAGNKFGFLEAHPLLNSQSLQVIDVSRCVISHLYPETFSLLPSLTTIDISKNFIVQLNLKIFENLSELNSLVLTDNKLHCNDEMTELISYLTKRRIKFQNICQKIEKSQKIIMQEITTEKSKLLNWNFDNCDIETIKEVSNTTKCEIMYENSRFSTVLIVVGFVCGIITGVSITCCYTNCIYLIKRRKRTSRRRNIVRLPLRQQRDDLLLSETSYNLGLSTPVLSRSRLSTIR